MEADMKVQGREGGGEKLSTVETVEVLWEAPGSLNT